MPRIMEVHYMYSEAFSTIIFTNNSTVVFNGEGGSIYSEINSEVISSGNS